jgi:hypothetical protein
MRPNRSVFNYTYQRKMPPLIRAHARSKCLSMIELRLAQRSASRVKSAINELGGSNGLRIALTVRGFGECGVSLRNIGDRAIDTSQHRVSDDGIHTEKPTSSRRLQSRDLSRPNRWIRGKVSGRILEPSVDWVTIIPSDAMRLRLDARVIIETDEHEIIYMSYNGRMHRDKENAARFRKGETLKADECYQVISPTFQTKSEKYSWLDDVQAVGKMVEYKNGDHLIYDLFVVK